MGFSSGMLVSAHYGTAFERGELARHLAATLVDLREQKRALVELAGHPLQVAPSVVQRRT